MRFYFSSIIIFVFQICISQIITGKITNENGNPLENVRIYIDGSQYSSNSNEKGSFSINLQNQKYGNLVFQKENYDVYSIDIAKLATENNNIELKKYKDIEEIVLTPYTEEAYKNFIGYFLNEFIGMDLENVKIKNQKTLKFSYDKANKLLKVKAPKTLIITNHNLGYEIYYDLISFESNFNSKMVLYSGTSYFKETSKKNIAKENRANAYYGSMMHFFRSVYTKTTEQEGYIVNHVIKTPNKNYPTNEELTKLGNFQKEVSGAKLISIPTEIANISYRKNNEKPYILSVLKAKIPENNYTKWIEGLLYLDFEDILHVNFKKYYFEFKKGELKKTESFTNTTTFLYPENKQFQIYADGNISDPTALILQGYFPTQKIENLLPLDYQVGD
ncbi:MAG: carboxypeptidase regulatory-like domain-containing protein [Bacteroidetes bacterium]|nr:carboxypeptidase regulatory-like domain-containing protein [Bacteroidota bacterium]